MTDFDDDLSFSLRALDAAIPASAAADVTVGRAVLARLEAPRGRRARRGVVLLAVAAALLVGASAVVGGRMVFAPSEQPALEAALARVFDVPDCLTAEQAEAAVRSTLVTLQMTGWDVERTGGVVSGKCVSYGIASESHSVLLVPGGDRAANAVWDAVSAALMDRCLSRNDAIEFVRTAFSSAGIPVEVQADSNGVQGAPVDQYAAYQAHVAAGCWVVSGVTSWNGSGDRIVFLWGP